MIALNSRLNFSIIYQSCFYEFKVYFNKGGGMTWDDFWILDLNFSYLLIIYISYEFKIINNAIFKEYKYWLFIYFMIIYKKEVEVEMKEILMYTTGICFLAMFVGGLATAILVADDSMEFLTRFFAKLTTVSLAVFIVSLFLLLAVFR